MKTHLVHDEDSDEDLSCGWLGLCSAGFLLREGSSHKGEAVPVVRRDSAKV